MVGLPSELELECDSFGNTSPFSEAFPEDGKSKCFLCSSWMGSLGRRHSVWLGRKPAGGTRSPPADTTSRVLYLVTTAPSILSVSWGSPFTSFRSVLFYSSVHTCRVDGETDWPVQLVQGQAFNLPLPQHLPLKTADSKGGLIIHGIPWEDSLLGNIPLRPSMHLLIFQLKSKTQKYILS